MGMTVSWANTGATKLLSEVRDYMLNTQFLASQMVDQNALSPTVLDV